MYGEFDFIAAICVQIQMEFQLPYLDMANYLNIP